MAMLQANLFAFRSCLMIQLRPWTFWCHLFNPSRRNISCLGAYVEKQHTDCNTYDVKELVYET
jgi:hypothetical protein